MMLGSPVGSLLTGVALDDALREIVHDAERVLAGVDGAGVAVHAGSGQAIAASNSLAATVDGTQYRTGQGPCLHAYRTNAVVVLDLNGRSPRWPVFQTAAIASGIRTVLSVPLRQDGSPIGTLNLYSRSRRAFSARVVRGVELYARPAALRLSPTGVAVHAVEAGEVIGLELQDRDTVERALGVLMGVHQDDSVEQARRRLGRAAKDLGLDIPLAAARIVAAPPAGLA